MGNLRVLRVFHAGRDHALRGRERSLARAGVELTCVVPNSWPEGGAERVLTPESFEMVELDVSRPGDINRHRYRPQRALQELVGRVQPDVVDIQAEPFSLSCEQWLRAAGGVPCVGYTAQNVDKRWPPPFARYERQALARLSGLYPCSRQAAAVVRGKGFAGLIDVLPLGLDAEAYRPGDQAATDAELVLGLVGRLVPHKGVRDAVEALGILRRSRPARLLLVGNGPEAEPALALAASLGLQDNVAVEPWRGTDTLTALYRSMHVVLVPSKATETWTEQFGRVIVEAQASGAVVAGYATGSIPEVCAGAGVLVPEGDSAALGIAVAELLAAKGRYQTLRQRGLARGQEMAWDRIAQQQIRFYEAAIRNARQPLPRSGRARRALAEAEFGSPAMLAGGSPRPFALPVLRRDRAWTRALGRLADLSDR